MTADPWRDRVLLVTGGTGSLGQALTRFALDRLPLKTLRIFSRDELKQWEMRQRFGDERLRFFLGDVRDRDRLFRACEGVDVVVHAAALKQVPACEYNPMEAIKTNVLGSANVVDAAIDAGVGQVLAISTDKAVNPVNLYGATKLCAEKVIVQGNAYTGGRPTRCSATRYGNVLGSRGSVVPFFLEQRERKVLPITDLRMTRFWITLPQAVEFVLGCVERMQGGELFVPWLPTVRVVDIAAAVAPECRLVEVGIRPGEKLHEVLLTEEETRRTWDCDRGFVVAPEPAWRGWQPERGAERLPEGFRYSSEGGAGRLTVEEIAAVIGGVER